MFCIALCSPVCANGHCLANNSCLCYPGWTGDRCRTGELSHIPVSVFLCVFV